MGELDGRPLLAEGREAEVFAWDDGTVLRLLRDPRWAPRMERTTVAIDAARARGVPTPAVVARVTVAGRPGLVMERVDGPDLLTLLGRRPWLLVSVAGDMGTIHARLHETVAPAELPALRDVARQRIRATPQLPARLADLALGLLDDLPDGDRICHGDYHPGNLLRAADGPVVIDWTNATRGDPMADVARTRLMFRLGEVPAGTSSVIRGLERFGRGAFARLYLRAYRRARPLDLPFVERWEIVRAADRFAEGIEGEYPALLAVLESRR